MGKISLNAIFSQTDKISFLTNSKSRANFWDIRGMSNSHSPPPPEKLHFSFLYKRCHIVMYFPVWLRNL